MAETIIPPALRERHIKGLKHFLATGEGPVLNQRLELPALHKDGHEFPVELNISSVRLGQSWMFSAFAHDISERKKHEIETARKNEELAAAYSELNRTTQEQIESKDQVLSHVSHELRTPLTAAHQFTTILLDGLAGELKAEQREYMEVVLRNLSQLREMIGDLLDTTRARGGKLTIEPKRVDLRALVTDLFRTLRSRAAEKQITLTLEDSTSFEAWADPARVRQIISNLLDNALKFTPADGKITARARVYERDADFVCVSVTDTGRGLPPEAHEKVFDRLYQVNGQSESARKGLGLGLYICKELVTRMGGKIWVESEVGKGATFYLTLPIFANQTATRHAAKE